MGDGRTDIIKGEVAFIALGEVTSDGTEEGVSRACWIRQLGEWEGWEVGELGVGREHGVSRRVFAAGEEV